jgi:[acyl-carrier-protein] S-malonyltransferase
MTLAFIFPGQGAQYVGMAKDLAATVPAARALLDQAEAALGLPLARLMAEGPEADLTRTDISQPVILLASLMALEALRARLGALPAFAATAGLSLGEYTALVAAGALDPLTALRLVRLRGEAMQAAAEAVPSGMVALLGGEEPAAQALCVAAAGGEVLQVANLNSPGQVVIAGAVAACARAVDQAKAHGFKRAIPLKVAGAFHSALMAPAAARLGAALANAAISDPRVLVYSNVTAAPVTRAADIPALLVDQLTRPVRWADSMVAMNRTGIDTFWEFGPGKTLSKMLAGTVPSATCRNVDGAADAAAFAAAAG